MQLLKPSLTPSAGALVHIESTGAEKGSAHAGRCAVILYLFLYFTVYIVVLNVVVCILYLPISTSGRPGGVKPMFKTCVVNPCCKPAI